MSSLPYSILTKEDNDILPLLSINDHQKFCKSLLKSYHSYKKKEEKADKYKYKSEEEILQTQKKQNQEEILKWFESLTEYQRIKICTIKNKWLVNIFLQLYLIYKTYDGCYIKPILEMESLFQDQNNFSHGNEDNKNQLLNNSINSLNYNNYENKKNFFPNDLNYYENFFSLQCKGTNYNMFDKKETERREKEKKLMDNIKLLSLEENIIDTFTLNRDILGNSKEIKEFLKYFSNDRYFQDWLLPIKVDNIYNFVLPQWMHNNNNLTLFQLIIGYIEQQILLNYEFFYYSKKIYDYSYSNLIIDLYEENKKLISFVKENYSFYNNNDDINKREFISLMEIREIFKNLKKSKNYEKKINFLQNIYNYVYNNEFNAKNKNCMLNVDFHSQMYKDLYEESMLGGELGIKKVLDHITFMQFNDVVNARDNLFTAFRGKIVENQNQKIINELISDDFLTSNSNKKKNKNKKRKKKNKNNENNSSNNNKKKEVIKEANENSSNKNNIENDKDLKISNDIKDNNTNNILNKNNNNNIEINEFNLDLKEEQKSIEIKNSDTSNIENKIQSNIKEDIININNKEKINIVKNNEKCDLNNLNYEYNNHNNIEKEISINNNPIDIEEDQKEELKIDNNKSSIKMKLK